jgi:mevalonate kinase
MKWQIPAKTFLLGEYAAIAEASAIILTTTPYFELSLIDSEQLAEIHPESPAGIWWSQQKYSRKGLSWYDPYHGLGGLGASSAQFLASYLASNTLQNKIPDLAAMLRAYYQSSWSGTGLRPSGYDVIAQSQQGCVYINKQKKTLLSYDWPFKDLSFLLLHTGIKLATHHHLQAARLPHQIEELSLIVDEAQQAFEQINSEQLLHAINNYHYQLNELNLVAQHSLEFINQLKTHPEVLAVKGCGAMGADVLLVLTAGHDAQLLHDKLHAQNWAVLATEKNLTPINQKSIISNRL